MSMTEFPGDSGVILEPRAFKAGWDAGAGHWQKEYEAQSALIGELVEAIELSMDTCAHDEYGSTIEQCNSCSNGQALIAKARTSIGK